MVGSMAGLTSGTRDALTRFTHPLTGAYYFVPSTESVRARIGASPGSTAEPAHEPIGRGIAPVLADRQSRLTRSVRQRTLTS